MREQNVVSLKRQNQRQHTARAGFTLVELLIATAIFSVVLVVIVGGYITMLSSSRLVRNQQQAVGGIAAAVEYFERYARLAEGVYCADNLPADFAPSASNLSRECPGETGGANSVALTIATDESGVPEDVVVFRVVPSKGVIERSFSRQGGSSGKAGFQAITPPNRVVLTSARFVVERDKDASAETPPRVLLAIEGRVGEGAEDTRSFHTQTVVSPPFVYVIPPDIFTPGCPECNKSDNPYCPFTDKSKYPNVYIIPDAGYAEKTGWSTLRVVDSNTPHNEPGSSHPVYPGQMQATANLIPFPIPPENAVPAGTRIKAVHIAAWDNHCNPKGFYEKEAAKRGKKIPELVECRDGSGGVLKNDKGEVLYTPTRYMAGGANHQTEERLFVVFYADYEPKGYTQWKKNKITAAQGRKILFSSDDYPNGRTPDIGDFDAVAATSISLPSPLDISNLKEIVFFHGGVNPRDKGEPNCGLAAGCQKEEEPNDTVHSFVPACVGVEFESGAPPSGWDRVKAKPF
ncbi:MAG: hypothetical protein KatS3mg099_408 [Candidatus Parcubacteria bacterium]|nr:MAG: hypothetical protein KatS3mg099_408 [Candidatus Parcubacteria bacterium]